MLASWSTSFGSLFLGCGNRYLTGTSTYTLTRTAMIFGESASSLDSFTWHWDSLSAVNDYNSATETVTATLSTMVITPGDIARRVERDSHAIVFVMAVSVVSPVSVLVRDSPGVDKVQWTLGGSRAGTDVRMKTSISSQTASTGTTSAASSSNSGLSSGAAAGVGVGVTLAAVGLLAGGAWLFWRHRKGLQPRTVPNKSPILPEAPGAHAQHYASPYELQTT